MSERMVRITTFLFVLAFWLGGLSLKAQNRDAGLWTSVNFEAKLVKRCYAGISQEFRFNENITELGTALTDAGLTYKLNKHFQFAVNYRFIQRRRSDNFYSLRHRFYLDVKYSRKLKPFEISFRSRLQNQIADIGRAADGGVPDYYLRNKLNISWNSKKAFKPYVSIELFSPLNYMRIYAFNEHRTAAGIEYELSKHHKLDVYYMIQKEFNKSDPLTEFIMGIGYFYKL